MQRFTLHFIGSERNPRLDPKTDGCADSFYAKSNPIRRGLAPATVMRVNSPLTCFMALTHNRRSADLLRALGLSIRRTDQSGVPFVGPSSPRARLLVRPPVAYINPDLVCPIDPAGRYERAYTCTMPVRECFTLFNRVSDPIGRRSRRGSGALVQLRPSSSITIERSRYGKTLSFDPAARPSIMPVPTASPFGAISHDSFVLHTRVVVKVFVVLVVVVFVKVRERKE
jgi:hypothetical protein